MSLTKYEQSLNASGGRWVSSLFSVLGRGHKALPFSICFIGATTRAAWTLRITLKWPSIRWRSRLETRRLQTSGNKSRKFIWAFRSQSFDVIFSGTPGKDRRVNMEVFPAEKWRIFSCTARRLSEDGEII